MPQWLGSGLRVHTNAKARSRVLKPFLTLALNAVIHQMSVATSLERAKAEDQYRAKAEELTVRAQGENCVITRALLESLAVNYLHLADHEKEHRLEVREKAWKKKVRQNGRCGECGVPIPYSSRDMYFGANLCVLCYRGLNARLSRLHDLALADPDFHRIIKRPTAGRSWPARSLRRSLRGALRFAGNTCAYWSRNFIRTLPGASRPPGRLHVSQIRAPSSGVKAP